MRIYLLAVIGAILCLRWLPVLPPLWLLSGALVIAVIMLRWQPVRVVGVFALALCWACWQATQVLADRLPDAWDGQTLWLEGYIDQLPQWSQSASGQQIVRFELTEASSRRTPLPSRIRLSWYNPQPVKAGERWRLAVSLKKPYGQLNPGTFDYQQWLTAKRIGATGSIKMGQRLQPASGFVAWREQLRERLYQLLPDQQSSAAVVALVLGDGSAIAREQWQNLRDSGTVHLFVISGQHISLLAGLAYGLVAWLHRWSLWPARLPWLPVACCLAAGSALFYGALAGFNVPVQRALIMVGIALIWRLRHLPLASWTPWLLALTAVLLHDPLVVLQPGLWLSFAAVAVLLLVFAWRLSGWRWWQVLWRSQLAAAVGLLPLLLALGLPVSIMGPLANAVAVPLISLLVLPLALLGALLLAWPVLAQPLLWLAATALHWMWQLLAFLVAQFPAWQAPELPFFSWVLALLATLLLLLPAVFRPWWLVLPLFLPLLLPLPHNELQTGRAQIWMLDVGQGQALVIRTARHLLVYDAGPAMGGLNAGEQVVLPFLRHLGAQRIDKMILSHADADHAGGAAVILQNLPVAELVSGEPQRHRQWQAQGCENKSWQWDEVSFWQWQWQSAPDGNEASCVLQIIAAGESFLVTGDLGVRGEQAMLAARPDLRAHWLVAGHHGSKTSTGAALLQQLKPQAVLVSRGRYNNYGHPHRQVVSAIAQSGAQLYDTAQQHAIRVDLGSFDQPWLMAQRRAFWRK